METKLCIDENTSLLQKNEALTSPILSLPQENGKPVVVILGGGDFGRSLATQLVHAKYHVIVASRNPAKTSARLANSGGMIMNQSEGLSKSPLVFVTVQSQHYSSLPISDLQNKVLIDVSNRTKYDTKSSTSNAENLQKLVPSAVVVKGFNNLSAYSLERNLHIGKEVCISCNFDWPIELVSEIARNLGLHPLRRGSLEQCREVEQANLKFFPEWRFTFIVSMVIFWFIWLLLFFRGLICINIGPEHKGPWNWSKFGKVMLCKATLGVTAIMLLALTYIPGVIAAYLQLYRGTKYSEFPKWLDTLLLSRKYLGLSALFFTLMHVTAEVLYKSMVSPPKRFYNTDVIYPFDWQTPTHLWFGLMAVALLCILGITSLPSVTNVLSWTEFVGIQSKLGWVSLIFATVHLIVVEWDALITNYFRCYILPYGGQIAIILPVLAIVMKLPLLIPCLNRKLTQIRRGYSYKK